MMNRFHSLSIKAFGGPRDMFKIIELSYRKASACLHSEKHIMIMTHEYGTSNGFRVLIKLRWKSDHPFLE